ncbi:MAG: ATP-binding protein [Bacteroidia bacterium]|nr:ATP-binding protein [Bacteroidia bacterium]
MKTGRLSIDPILEMVLLRVRLYARRRIAWLRKLWREEGDPGGPLAVTHAEIDACLDYRDSPEAETHWYGSDNLVIGLNQEIEKAESFIATDENSRFTFLHNIFGLSSEESDLFQLCLAIKLDPSLARLYAYLHDHAGRGYASEELAIRLFGYGHSSIWRPDSSLAQWELIHEKETAPGEPTMLKCDRSVVQWLLGQDTMDALLAPVARFYPALPPLQNWPVDNTVKLLERLINQGSRPVRVILNGPEGSGRKTMAAIVCARFNMRLLEINSDNTEDWAKLFLHAQRQALLNRCGIAWYGANVLEKPWPLNILCSPLQFVICEPGQKPKPSGEIIETSVDLPPLTLSEQLELIKKHLPVSATWEKNRIDLLVTQHRMNIGDIIAMREADVQTPEEASGSMRESYRYRLGTLAQLLECPFAWDDLVLPEFLRDSLEDFVFEARERKIFWEQENARKLFPQGRGLIGLFSGPPGTGKTMAAQVIAANLGLDLFRIDLSSVVSKYVGETSQNLERILSRAEHMDIVLLFDEADALFGKRTEVKDAHDRFANTDTNYLLQAIENYRGIAILASNKKENIDNAFIRRLRYVLEFPKPDARQREQIWLKILNKLLADENRPLLNGQIKTLANNVELTGAQIKFAVLSALFAAKRDKKPPEIKHLIRGMEREMMKEGRALSNREREKLMEHAG